MRVAENTNKEDRKEYLDSIAGFMVQNDNTIILPGTKEQFDFEFATMELPQAAQIGETIKRHDSKISDGLLAFFIKL